MDSRHWHDHAQPPSLTSPEAWTATQLEKRQAEDRRRYAVAVRRHLRSQPLTSPKHETVAYELDDALCEAESEPPGARTILSLSAPFAVGKSSQIKHWARRHYRQWVTNPDSDQLPEWEDNSGTRFDFVPIIYVTLMARSQAKDVHGALLTFLGYPSRGSVSEITLRTTNALRNHRVRLVIVDDAHMLHTSSITGRETLDALKQINTELGELGGTMVLVGANLTDGPALSDPQVRARLHEHHLSPYTIDTPEQMALWQRLLDDAEPRLATYLPDLEPGQLSTKLPGLIFKRTQGFIGDVSSLLAGATYNALIAGRAHLEHRDLAGVRLSQRAHDGERQLDTRGGSTTPGNAPLTGPPRARRKVS